MEAWSVTITTSVLSFHISWFKVSIREGGWRGTGPYKTTELQFLEITCNQNVCKRTAVSSQQSAAPMLQFVTAVYLNIILQALT
jgi:hypothetical protein